MERDYLKAKCFGLLIPYLTYMVIDFVLIRRETSAEIVFRMLYGGRAISGVYWYITCFLFTLFALGFLINHCSEKTVKRLILAGGGYSGNRVPSCGYDSFASISRHPVES